MPHTPLQAMRQTIPHRNRFLCSLMLAVLVSVLSGCATTGFTSDDGRKVNEALLAQIRSFGEGEQALRPAIARAAKLTDPDCDKQWELPFSVATSHNWEANDRVAWSRALGVDERLTVVAVAVPAPVKLRDKIVDIAGYHRDNATKMLQELSDRRDAGRPFDVRLSNGQSVKVTPFELCRGYTRLAPPDSPHLQDYHWLMSVHPLQVTQAKLTEDEALWAVLWTQGLSEEGGARMKTYHYATKVASALYNVFTIATGLKGAAMAADAAIKAAQTVAANAVNEALKKQVMEQATSLALSKLRDGVTESAQKLTQQQVVNAMQQAASNRGSLGGVARVAATVFDKADVWAYTRMEKLGADPLAGFRVHQKLIEQGLTRNAMVFDPERMDVLSKWAQDRGRGDDVVAVLGGLKPESLQFALLDMPVASAQGGFAYDVIGADTSDDATFSHGFIEGILTMPLESKLSN
jgi:hypothetical protein